MAKRKTEAGKLGIVCAWRQGEDDLAATIESAAASAGTAANIYAVEDKDRHGPARTRHRGIEAATDCDVVAIIDAHMRFDGACLASMARHVRKTGGLACATVYHNAECAMTGGAYYGGRIVYRSKDGRAQNALAIKWARNQTPGPRGAVVGACYVMPRELYYATGQPLAALPGWGCDEEALSISAWMAGRTVECLPESCAHRYRAQTPWPLTDAEHTAVHASRMALIHAVVSECNARCELEAWQRAWVREGIPACRSAEAERWRLALLKCARSWRQWRAEVCEPEEIDGVQPAMVALINQQRRNVFGGEVVLTDAMIADARAKFFPASIRNPTAPLHGVKCPHCQTVHDPKRLRVTHTYGNGNRRHPCPTCGNNFISMFRPTAQPAAQ
jgi:hypothetical protein